MANPIIMPKLGQMTEESTVVRGSRKGLVAKGDILRDRNDKAGDGGGGFYEVPREVHVKKGDRSVYGAGIP